MKNLSSKKYEKHCFSYERTLENKFWTNFSFFFFTFRATLHYIYIRISSPWPNFQVSFFWLQVILFEIDCANFYKNLLELFCQFISWTNLVNSGKFMDNYWNYHVKLWLIWKKLTMIHKRNRNWVIWAIIRT